jgi:hypothetical protein
MLLFVLVSDSMSCVSTHQRRQTCMPQWSQDDTWPYCSQQRQAHTSPALHGTTNQPVHVACAALSHVQCHRARHSQQCRCHPLLPPATNGQLHFAQYGGFLQLGNLQLEGRATSTGFASASGGVSIKRSRDGSDDGQPATFAALTVTFK